MSGTERRPLLSRSVVVLALLGAIGLFGAPLAAALAGQGSLVFAWTDGARSTLAAASIVMVVAFTFGVTAGGAAALGPPLFDALLARAMEIAGALPTFAVVVIVRMLMPTSELMTIAVVLAVLRGLSTAKVVRADLLQLKAEEFVLSARALGATRTRLFRSHLFPHIAGPSLADAAHAAAAVVGLDAALSLAGLGAGDRTWGALMAQAVATASPSAAVVPALGVAATVAALLVVADALEDQWSVGRRFL